MADRITRELDVVHPNGETRRFRIEFGVPYPDETGFRCEVIFSGWFQSPPPIHGNDSYEALKRAIEFVYVLLKHFTQTGIVYRMPGQDAEFDIADFLIGDPEME